MPHPMSSKLRGSVRKHGHVVAAAYYGAERFHLVKGSIYVDGDGQPREEPLRAVGIDFERMEDAADTLGTSIFDDRFVLRTRSSASASRL